MSRELAKAGKGPTRSGKLHYLHCPVNTTFLFADEQTNAQPASPASWRAMRRAQYYFSEALRLINRATGHTLAEGGCEPPTFVFGPLRC